jgi:hypothetical protein
VTELIRPLAAKRREVRDVAVEHHPSFSELVYAHYAWWKTLHAGQADEELARRYHAVKQAFEAAHGRVVHAFWCSNVESAVALTHQRRHFWQRRRCEFHRESDWATKEHPEVAAELHRCDALAVRAQTVLTGMRQRICLQLVSASAAHLLSLVDTASGSPDAAGARETLDRERKELAKTGEYYRQAANGQAQVAYFAGMAAVAIVIAVAALLNLAVAWDAGVAAMVAGVAGAVVSVTQRINHGDFELEYDVGRPYAFFLGALRPLIGGTFALIIYFAFTSGITHLPVSGSDPDADRRLAILVVGFVAGFSERWAQDTLATAAPVQAPAVAAAPETETTPPTQ